MRRYFRHRVLLVGPFVLIVLITVAGGIYNTVDARGRMVDDTTGLAVSEATVSFGNRVTVTDANGAYVLTSLPRGARLQTQHRLFGRNNVAAEQTEFRVTPLTITFEVKDAVTGKGVESPEARQPVDKRVGLGSAGGEMVVGPYPARDIPLLICAATYQSKEVVAKGSLMDVLLTPGGSGCPPLPTPAVSPSPSPSPAAPAPSASGAAPSPTPSPTPAR